MQTVDLGIKVRSKIGGRHPKRLRRSGAVPAVVYGHGMTPLSVEVDARSLNQALNTKAGENVIVRLNAEGVTLKESTCLIKQIQHDPITEAIQHVDFTIVSLTEKIEVDVPVVVKNADEAAGVKAGGVLDVVHHEIRVSCLPTQIPESIVVDVKALQISEAVHVRDLSIPEGVEILLELEEVVIALHPPREEEKAAGSEEGAVQPEVIEKGKKPEEGESAAAAPAAKK